MWIKKFKCSCFFDNDFYWIFMDKDLILDDIIDSY